MRCPFCEAIDSKVVDSRSTDECLAIRRRRECQSCGRRFTTYETIEMTPIIVIKKDGSRERFERKKVLNGMMIACEKRPVGLETLEQAVLAIENSLRQRGQGEVRSQEVGERVMEKLKEIDQVAYVRFASVYRQFADINSFVRELENLRNRN
ncbi:MAG: transcriptional regulator NrdR [Negativicutes bacterium]|nr:transcriptional regulator NrdR [Negativicutes bacterium]